MNHKDLPTIERELVEAGSITTREVIIGALHSGLAIKVADMDTDATRFVAVPAKLAPHVRATLA